MSLRHNLRRYFEFSQQEWRDLLITGAVIGFILSFNRWDEANVARGVIQLVLFVVAATAFLIVHTAIVKVFAIMTGLVASFEKYIIGLLFGVFVAFFTSVFLFIPFFVTGSFTYRAVDNLRAGRFRAVLPKHWELGMIAALATLAMLVVSVPFGLLHAATGAAVLRDLQVTAFLIGAYALLPLPVISTTNPYAVYMSRLESLRGNLPGYDLFYASTIWYAFIVGFTLVFGVISLVFTPSLFLILLAALGGLGMMAVFSRLGRVLV